MLQALLSNSTISVGWISCFGFVAFLRYRHRYSWPQHAGLIRHCNTGMLRRKSVGECWQAVPASLKRLAVNLYREFCDIVIIWQPFSLSCISVINICFLLLCSFQQESGLFLNCMFQHLEPLITEIIPTMLFELESQQMPQLLFLFWSHNMTSDFIEVCIQSWRQCLFLLGEIVQVIIHNITVQR